MEEVNGILGCLRQGISRRDREMLNLNCWVLVRYLRSSAWSRDRAAGVIGKLEERISGERIGQTGLL